MLEDGNSIDMIMAKDTELTLVISDAGITTDPIERLKLLKQKIHAYCTWLTLPATQADYAGAGNCKIRVVCADSPTPDMAQISGVHVIHADGAKQLISVSYEVRSGRL